MQPYLFIQAYMMKDYTLSILFLTQAATLCNKPSTTTSPTLAASGVESKTLGVREVAGAPGVREFAVSLVRVLLHTSQFTDTIAKVLLPVIDR